jgi:hypothetical protein
MMNSQLQDEPSASKKKHKNPNKKNLFCTPFFAVVRILDSDSLAVLNPDVVIKFKLGFFLLA